MAVGGGDAGDAGDGVKIISEGMILDGYKGVGQETG
jgi:hypothetical protein